MDLFKSEFFCKIKNMIDPVYVEKDYSFYTHKLKSIAPLSFQLLGEEFFIKAIPLYFKEIETSEENVVENIFYFPLFFRKIQIGNQKKYKTQFPIEDYNVELMDYEFALYIMKSNPATPNLSNQNDIPKEIFQNPISQAIRHEYDIHGFVKTYANIPNSSPTKIKTLLLISKDPNTNEIYFMNGNIHHAAIVDELHDGKIAESNLLQTLLVKYPKVNSDTWITVLKELKNNFFILLS